MIVKMGQKGFSAVGFLFSDRLLALAMSTEEGGTLTNALLFYLMPALRAWFTGLAIYFVDI